MPATPRTITLIRHAEKPDEKHPDHPPLGVNEDGQPSPTSLTVRGWQRAGALTVQFGQHIMPLARPSSLYAPAYPDGPSHRPRETITPLARHLGLTIHTPQPKGNEAALVTDHLLREPDADILVCWEHHHLPALAAALAASVHVSGTARNAVLWPDDDFSSALVYSRNGNGAYTLVQVRVG
ncbi:histidine phosphatase family protein [Deinococcus sp. KSM4-11]|uniref:histidine phosphatase family protein n=1 Tax=Deinococcus sp. KSM4-11 TaxID=2568654 RepID=UPI0010A32921|nr:histidine phosphatase family protein [Deinococcus sp. KSM4-11]THF86540.1 histidine phosphatase family protein [Deinococcus sp. KSM4-11]